MTISERTRSRVQFKDETIRFGTNEKDLDTPFIALGSNFRRITLEEIPNPHKFLRNLINYQANIPHYVSSSVLYKLPKFVLIKPYEVLIF